MIEPLKKYQNIHTATKRIRKNAKSIENNYFSDGKSIDLYCFIWLIKRPKLSFLVAALGTISSILQCAAGIVDSLNDSEYIFYLMIGIIASVTLLIANLQLFYLLTNPRKLRNVLLFKFNRIDTEGFSRNEKLAFVIFVYRIVAVLILAITSYMYLAGEWTTGLLAIWLWKVPWFQACYFMIIVVQIQAKVINRYCTLNKVLSTVCATGESLSKSQYCSLKAITSIAKSTNLKKLRNLVQYHNQLCNTIDNMNSIFSLRMFCMIQILATSIFCGTQYLINLDNIYMHATEPTFLILWILEPTLYLFLLAYVGEALVSEEQRTLCICYDFLNDSSEFEDSHRDVMVEEVDAFVDQITSRPSYFSALFLNLGNNVLSFVLANITQFIIVYTQFWSSARNKMN